MFPPGMRKPRPVTDNKKTSLKQIWEDHMKFRSSLLVAGAMAFAMLASTPVRALEEASLRLNWQILGMHTPFYLGVERGYYKDEGIDLKISEGRGGGTTAQAIGAKSDTFGMVDGGTVVVSAVRGVPIKTVLSLMNRGIFAIVAREDAGINKPKDLEGKSIAATAGDALTQLLPAVIKYNNLDRDKIRIINVDAASKVVTVLEKRADALLGSVDAQSFDMAAKGVKSTMLSYDDIGVPLVGLTIIVNEDTIKSNPDLIKRFNRATQKSFEAAMQDPYGAVDAARKVKPEINREVCKSQLEISLAHVPSENTKGKPIGWGSDKDWSQMVALLKEYQNLPTERTGDTFFTNAFVQ
jgi:NitT/TauT family transport system substrate-binding protein